MANNTVELEYDKSERTDSETNGQTTPEVHTNSIENKAIMAACKHISKIISGIKLMTAEIDAI